MMMMVGAAMMLSTVSFAGEKNNKKVMPFEGVSVNAPAHVRFVYGDEYKVDIQSADTLAVSALRVTVKDGILKIRAIDEFEALPDVFITIMSPVEPKLTVGRNMEVKNLNRESSALAKK